MPKNDQIWPKIGIFGQFGPGHAGLFGALLVGRLVVVARGLYLARHLFSLFENNEYVLFQRNIKTEDNKQKFKQQNLRSERFLKTVSKYCGYVINFALSKFEKGSKMMRLHQNLRRERRKRRFP